MSSNMKKGFSTSLPERWAFYSYPLGMNFLGMLSMTFLPLFYTDRLGISATATGTLFLLARFCFALVDPLLGGMIDRMHFRGGKFLPWLTWGALLAPVVTLLLFLQLPWSPQVKLIYAYLSYLLSGILTALGGVPHGALATAMTQNQEERSVLLSKSMLSGIVGSVLVGILGGPMIQRLDYFPSVLMIASAALLTMIPLKLNVKERFRDERKPEQSLKQMVLTILKNKPLMAVNFSFLFVMATSFATSVGIYFVQWNLGSLDLMALVMGASFLPVVILPIITPRLIGLIGKRRLYLYGLLLGFALSILQYFLGYENLALFLTINGFKLLGIYTPVVLLNQFLADCVEYDTHIHGVRKEGMIFALGSLFNKIGGAISGGLPIILLGLFGYDGMAGSQTAQALRGIWLLMSLIPAGGLLLAATLFASFYWLKEEDIAGMMEDSVTQQKQELRHSAKA